MAFVAPQDRTTLRNIFPSMDAVTEDSCQAGGASSISPFSTRQCRHPGSAAAGIRWQCCAGFPPSFPSPGCASRHFLFLVLLPLTPASGQLPASCPGAQPAMPPGPLPPFTSPVPGPASLLAPPAWLCAFRFLFHFGAWLPADACLLSTFCLVLFHPCWCSPPSHLYQGFMFSFWFRSPPHPHPIIFPSVLLPEFPLSQYFP